MNNALTLKDFGLSFPGEKPLESALVLVASRSAKAGRELSASAGEVFSGVSEMVEQLLMSAIEKRTSAEFNEAFEVSFPKYVALALSFGQIVEAIVPSDVRERLARESICELEADFREKSLVAFGAVVRDQAMFTIWTLRKVADILIQMSDVELGEAKRAEDKEYCGHYIVHALRAKFCLDCLTTALRVNRPVYPEVMGAIQDGLRSMVNAYAWARRGSALRFPSPEPPLEVPSDDEEEEQLLRASMQDMALMSDEPLNAD
jgi:hypothetical protein